MQKRQKIEELLNQGKTQRDIAHRLKISQPRVCKIIKKFGLKQGGLSKRGGGLSKGLSKPTPKWECNGFHFVIHPYYVTQRYERMMYKRGNWDIFVGDWHYFFSKSSIQVRQKKGHRYSHAHKYQALAMLQDSLNESIEKAQQKFGFRVYKTGNARIRLVRHELAVNPSDMARKCAYLAATGKDGKIWLLLDHSKGAEREYVHPEYALDDSEIIEPFLNDLRRDPPKNTELAHLMSELIKQNKETAAGLYTVVQLLQPGKLRDEAEETEADYIG